MNTQQVKISSVTLYELYEEIDKDEGRGGQRLAGYAATEEIARMRAKSFGVMGTPGPIKEVEAYVLTDLKNEVVGHFLKSNLIPMLLTDPEIEKADREKAQRKYNEMFTARERALLELK